MLAKGWTLGASSGLRFMHGVIRLYHKASVRLLTDYWRSHPADMIVSLVPNFNRAMFQAVNASLPAAYYVSILTDFADYPPHFWMESQDQHFSCGTEKAVEQALVMGHPKALIFRASGMILRPRFYDPVTVDRATERAKLGLDPSKPTGLVLFGGQGSKVMLSI